MDGLKLSVYFQRDWWLFSLRSEKLHMQQYTVISDHFLPRKKNVHKKKVIALKKCVYCLWKGVCINQKVFQLLSIEVVQLCIAQLQCPLIARPFDSIHPSQTRPASSPSTLKTWLVHCFSCLFLTYTFLVSLAFQNFFSHSVTHVFPYTSSRPTSSFLTPSILLTLHKIRRDSIPMTMSLFLCPFLIPQVSAPYVKYGKTTFSYKNIWYPNLYS